MELTARYVLAVLLPPAAVVALGRRSATFAPIGVFFAAAVVTWVLAPWTPWMFLGNGFWAIAEVWAVLTIRGEEDDRRREPASTAEHHVSPERHFPAEDRVPPED